jgi:2-dehydro-3-deoxyglucarate aldolase/4-hydroxy-2-oxoheptanedioate aldolase
VANADAIASISGVDVLWVGHFDLSQAMGIPAQFHHRDFLDAIQKVISAAREHGKVAGINPRSHEQADEWIAAGFNAISWGNDVTVYREALSSAVQALRRRMIPTAGAA